MQPSKMYEKERIESEIKLCGQYGLKTKREIWRVQLVLTRLRKRARELLTLDEHDERRIFEGNALMRKMFKYGLLDAEKENKLDYVLALTIEKLLERRLQTRVFKTRFASSIHHARVIIRGRHIAVNNQLVNVPSYLLTVDNENKVNYHVNSPLNGNKLGRRAKKRAANK